MGAWWLFIGGEVDKVWKKLKDWLWRQIKGYLVGWGGNLMGSDKGGLGKETPGVVLMGLAQDLRQLSLSLCLHGWRAGQRSSRLPVPMTKYLRGELDEQKWALQPFPAGIHFGYTQTNQQNTMHTQTRTVSGVCCWQDLFSGCWVVKGSLLQEGVQRYRYNLTLHFSVLL